MKPLRVKSAATNTSVAKSRIDVMGLLERYGGTGFGYEITGDDIIVSFSVRGQCDQPLKIAYPINIARIQERLGPVFKAMRKGAPNRDQAERVAWRNIFELIDAAFAAAAIGASTIEEAFFAHLVMRTDDGREGRLFDYVGSIENGGVLPAARRLSAGPSK